MGTTFTKTSVSSPLCLEISKSKECFDSAPIGSRTQESTYILSQDLILVAVALYIYSTTKQMEEAKNTVKQSKTGE